VAGALRRQTRASSVASSAAIEGYSVPANTAVALVSERAAADPADVSELAVAAYGRAMDHVAAMAADPGFRWNDRVILDLHFDACHFQRDRRPGRWREGPIHVTAPEGGIAFTGPDAGQVPKLMGEVVRWLGRGGSDAHLLVRAAMAHLHVVSVHPFEDGNGRVARIVQSLVVARDGLLTPEFGSIEEYLGSHTPGYYAALREAQGGSYQPGRDATAWVEFCVQAHISQAQTRLGQIDRAAARWAVLEAIAVERGWPDRLVTALEQVAMGGTRPGELRRRGRRIGADGQRGLPPASWTRGWSSRRAPAAAFATRPSHALVQAIEAG